MNLAELRANTLSNNLVWLRSFGCTVKSEGKLIVVHHPKLREFSACLVVEDDSENASRLASVISQAAREGLAPDVYLDREVKDGSVHELLQSNGFQPIITSIVTAARVRSANSAGRVVLERATIDQRTLWCAMYAEGFGRDGEVAQREVVERWNNTFVSEEVHNWFLVRNGKRIGICQTCKSNRVVGLYSLTLLPAERGVSKLISAFRVLQAKLGADGELVAYFERTRPYRRTTRRVRFSTGTFKTIREFTGFRRSL